MFGDYLNHFQILNSYTFSTCASGHAHALEHA